MTLPVLALLLLVPITPENSRFTIRLDGKTIGTEEFSIAMNGKGYVARGRTQLLADPTPITSRMELDENLNPTSYEYTHGSAAIRIKVAMPASELTVVDRGEASSTDFRFPDSGSIVDNNFFHHYLLLLYRVKSANQNIPIFVPQVMQAGQARIQSTGRNSYDLEVGDVKITATTDADGRLLRLTVPAAKVVVER